MKGGKQAVKPLIGFIGQGYIGKNYADDFEKRGFKTVRYALEEPHISNKEKIADCDIVFIAVPTPTTPAGFDDSIVRSAVELVGEGKVAIIKSTIVPGTTKSIQTEYPDRVIFFSPEFLSGATAAHDAAHPFSNIVGMAISDDAHRATATSVLATLPKASFELVCDSTQAEIIKYAHNGSGYVQVVFFNMMYDLAQKSGIGWEPIQKAIESDPFMAGYYARPLQKTGRGAGGHCFIKDFAALRALYEMRVGDLAGIEAFKAFEQKNISLLRSTKKDLNLLEDVYGSA